MFLVHVASEYAPLAKVGGLGDVVASLSKELGTCSVVLPYYSFIENASPTPIHFTTPYLNGHIEWNVFTKIFGKVTIFLLQPNNDFFSRSQIYGEIDDNERFISFSQAAAAFIQQEHPAAVVHLHDWQSALAALLLPLDTHIVFTIHNLLYQGHCGHDQISAFHLQSHLDYLLHNDAPHLMKGALLRANAITTVSPTYADEIQTPEFGAGFDPLLKTLSHKLHGILNGIDGEYWNPETDHMLAAQYSLSNPCKRKNKEALFQKLGKPFSDAPLYCTITRLVPQKGPELIIRGGSYVLENGASFMLSGVTIPDTRELVDSFIATHGENPQCLLNFTFNEELAHLIYAAADYILVPSHFEPCGLTQIIALCYGTIPIVTPVGGLKDTVEDGVNGFHIHDKNIEKAIAKTLSQTAEERAKMIATVRPERFSWAASLQEYITLYSARTGEAPTN